jgi:hypothetical protein
MAPEKTRIDPVLQRSRDFQSSVNHLEYGKAAMAMKAEASINGYSNQVLQAMTFNARGNQLKKDEEEEPVQMQEKDEVSTSFEQNTTGLPDQLKSGVENLSGISLDDVQVHYNSDKPMQLNAHAFAQGTHIHVAAGQEKHLPHEAWHVVQQKQGRVQPTLQLKGEEVNDDEGLEREADVMGAQALQSGSDENTSVNHNRQAKTNTQSLPIQKKSTGQVIQCALPIKKFYFTEDNGATSKWVDQEWAENLYEKQGKQGFIYSVYGYKSIVKTLVKHRVDLESIDKMLNIYDEDTLSRITSKTKCNHGSLITLVERFNEADLLLKLLNIEPDAAKLRSVVILTRGNYEDLALIIPKVNNYEVLKKLLKMQPDAKELWEIVEKTNAHYDSLVLLIEKIANTKALVNLLTKQPDAQALKEKLGEIIEPLKEDGLKEDNAWKMFATLSEKDSFGPAEIETLITTMRGHLKKDAEATAEEKSYITEAKPEGTKVGKKVLSGAEIEAHLRHTVDNGERAGKDIEMLFPTGQNFKAMSNDELWYYCAFSHTNVTPGFQPGATTGTKLKDLKTNADETPEQALIRQKLALRELKTRYGKPEAVQRMFFENEGQRPRCADTPDVEDNRAASTGAHTQDRHVIDNTGNIQNDMDLAYRITRHKPAFCPGQAGAFNSLLHGKAEIQTAFDYLYNNNLWPIWREEILSSGSKQDQIPCNTTSQHILMGAHVGVNQLPRYIHQGGQGYQPMHPNDDWKVNMTRLANANTMIVPNAQPAVAIPPGMGSVTINVGGDTFSFAGITVGPQGGPLTNKVAGVGVELRVVVLEGAKGGFGINSAWPY